MTGSNLQSLPSCRMNRHGAVWHGVFFLRAFSIRYFRDSTFYGATTERLERRKSDGTFVRGGAVRSVPLSFRIDPD